MCLYIEYMQIGKGYWKGHYNYQDIYYLMSFQAGKIQVDPPGVIFCHGSDMFGNFTLKGGFVANNTVCTFRKTYQPKDQYSEGYSYLYVGEVFYPPLMKMKNTQGIPQKNVGGANQGISTLHKVFLYLQRKRIQNPETPFWLPITNIMIRGIYAKDPNDVINIFCLTYVPPPPIQAINVFVQLGSLTLSQPLIQHMEKQEEQPQTKTLGVIKSEQLPNKNQGQSQEKK